MARPDNDQTARRKLNLVGGKTLAVSIPIDIVRSLDLKKQDPVIVRRVGQKIIIEKDNS
ncbi:AbrB/MazE/SpoVT family DNA-binding domain-containing protein [Candidatus Saccharibacteria bacterium]|nr:AbrB/MazE/SpoVT family DNA-binding domain-containing protein [Candidatus Saccharibacteria bacterium]